jgi:CRP/FNR family transcriptional regulator
MKTGQHFRNIILIVSGLVKVYREDDQGNEFLMYYLAPGQACSLSMICASRFQASQLMAKAESDVEVLAIPLQKMDEWMTTYKSWYYFVLETYRSRFEELLVVIGNIAFKNMDERLEWYLKQQAVKLGKQLSLTHQQIANDLSSSREVISRLLKKMEKNQIVSCNNSKVRECFTFTGFIHMNLFNHKCNNLTHYIFRVIIEICKFPFVINYFC